MTRTLPSQKHYATMIKRTKVNNGVERSLRAFDSVINEAKGYSKLDSPDDGFLDSQPLLCCYAQAARRRRKDSDHRHFVACLSRLRACMNLGIPDDDRAGIMLDYGDTLKGRWLSFTETIPQSPVIFGAGLKQKYSMSLEQAGSTSSMSETPPTAVQSVEISSQSDRSLSAQQKNSSENDFKYIEIMTKLHWAEYKAELAKDELMNTKIRFEIDKQRSNEEVERLSKMVDELRRKLDASEDAKNMIQAELSKANINCSEVKSKLDAKLLELENAMIVERKEWIEKSAANENMVNTLRNERNDMKRQQLFDSEELQCLKGENKTLRELNERLTSDFAELMKKYRTMEIRLTVGLCFM
ncbi:unnamed protein product [Soboliphyme baturini]|uniref:Girdin-like n=1 Tax=Soboliphyme baturini TaxID=241478 RepID=A0A183IF70_9BILA|nr:unnamed protein product [Soboliphyme baturini]